MPWCVPILDVIRNKLPNNITTVQNHKKNSYFFIFLSNGYCFYYLRAWTFFFYSFIYFFHSMVSLTFALLTLFVLFHVNVLHYFFHHSFSLLIYIVTLVSTCLAIILPYASLSHWSKKIKFVSFLKIQP